MIAIPKRPAANHTFNHFTLASGFKIEEKVAVIA